MAVPVQIAGIAEAGARFAFVGPQSADDILIELAEPPDGAARGSRRACRSTISCWRLGEI